MDDISTMALLEIETRFADGQLTQQQYEDAIALLDEGDTPPALPV